MTIEADEQSLFTVTYAGDPRWVVRAVSAKEAVKMCEPMLGQIDYDKPVHERLGPPDPELVKYLGVRVPTEEEAQAFRAEAGKIGGGDVELAIWPIGMSLPSAD